MPLVVRRSFDPIAGPGLGEGVKTIFTYLGNEIGSIEDRGTRHAGTVTPPPHDLLIPLHRGGLSPSHLVQDLGRLLRRRLSADHAGR